MPPPTICGTNDDVEKSLWSSSDSICMSSVPSLLGLSDGEDSQRAVTTFLRLKTKSADDNENNEANRDNEAKWE